MSSRRERGERIRARREALGLEVDELARKARTVPATIRNWEAGRTDMTIDRMLDLCKALRLGVLELIE